MAGLPHPTEFPENHHYIPDPGWATSAFTVVRAGKVIAAPGYRIERAEYPGQDVLFCCSGRGFALTEGTTVPVGTGHLVWIANEFPHAHWPDEADPWTLLWVRLIGPNFIAIRRKIFGSGPRLVAFPRTTAIEGWFSRAFSVLRNREADIDFALNCLVAEFLHMLAASAAQRDQVPLPAPLRVIMAQMRAAPEQVWRAEAVAAMAGISAAQMRRLFRRHLRLSPHRWLMAERIMLSQRLLLEPSATVADVAERCGFCDVYHFSRAFKRAVGIGPGTWCRAEKTRRDPGSA